MVTPAGFEPAAFRFVVKRSIQLGYGVEYIKTVFFRNRKPVSVLGNHLSNAILALFLLVHFPKGSSPTKIRVSASWSLPLFTRLSPTYSLSVHFITTLGCVSRFRGRQSLALPHLAMGTNITTITGRGSLDFPQYCIKQYRNFPFLKMTL